MRQMMATPPNMAIPADLWSAMSLLRYSNKFEAREHTPIHALRINLRKQREEANDRREQLVQHSDDVDRYGPASKRPASWRQGLAVESAPQHAADAESVGQSHSSSHQADDAVEDLAATKVQKRDDNENHQGRYHRVDGQRRRVDRDETREPAWEW